MRRLLRVGLHDVDMEKRVSCVAPRTANKNDVWEKPFLQMPDMRGLMCRKWNRDFDVIY